MFVFTSLTFGILYNILSYLRNIGIYPNENGKWRRLHNEELHSLYFSLNILRVIKSRRLRWAGHVVKTEEGRSAFKIFTGKPSGSPRRR